MKETPKSFFESPITPSLCIKAMIKRISEKKAVNSHPRKLRHDLVSSCDEDALLFVAARLLTKEKTLIKMETFAHRYRKMEKG
jgi:hypothetical protein